MGFLSALFNPNKKTNTGYYQAIAEINRARGLTDPFFQQQLTQGGQASGLLADLLGINGIGAAQSAMGNWQRSPGYQAGLDAGQRQIDQGAAGRGLLLSGDTVKASQQFGQDYQNREYNAYLDRLASMGGGGYSGAQGLLGTAQGMGDLYINKGRAQDAGRQSALANILGIAGTAVGAFTGMPGGGRMF